MRYYAAFDVSLLPAWTLTVNPATGTAANVTTNTLTGNDGNGDSTTLFFHFGLVGGSLVSYGFYGLNHDSWFQSSGLGLQNVAPRRLEKYANAPLAAHVESAIRSAGTTAGNWSAGPSNFDVTFDNDTAQYTFSYAENFTLSWSDTRHANFYGFTGTLSGASSYTSTITPTFCISPTVAASDIATPWFEAEGVSSMSVADDGSSFAISRSTAPLRQTWRQAFETKEKTLRHLPAIGEIDTSGSVTHPWTFQDLFYHCRSEYPFVVHDGFGEADTVTTGSLGISYNSIAYRFTDEGAFFNSREARATPGNDNQFHIPFDCIIEGFAIGQTGG